MKDGRFTSIIYSVRVFRFLKQHQKTTLEWPLQIELKSHHLLVLELACTDHTWKGANSAYP